jgi:cysteine desulfurase
MIYLDHHSTTPVDPAVFEAMKPYFLEKFGNASHGTHRLNWEAEAAVEHARNQVAEPIGAHGKEVIFTSGATESNHLAIIGIAASLESVQRKKILTLEIEHSSVLGACDQLRERGFVTEFVRTDAFGRVDLDDLKTKLTSEVGLVSIAFANHEIGTIQDIETISKLVHASGAFFHTDAVQAFGKILIDVNRYGIDLLTLSAHKIHGPKGVGALYVRRKNPRIELEPLFWGANQEWGLRAGTPNTPGIVGFGKASEIAGSTLEESALRMAELRDFLWKTLVSNLSGVTEMFRNGSSEHALPNNLNVSVSGVDGAAMFGRFKNLAVSNASACVSGVQDYSKVLSVLGVSPQLAKASLRFGLSRFTTREEILAAAAEVTAVVSELRKIEREFAIQTGV